MRFTTDLSEAQGSRLYKVWTMTNSSYKVSYGGKLRDLGVGLMIFVILRMLKC